MNITWEDIAPLICTSCGGACDAANQGPDNEMSPQRFVEQHGCESKEVYEAAECVATYINDLSALQEEGWKRAQAMLAEQRRKSSGFQKLKTWWSEDKNWFCILSDDGINQTTISLTVEEATLLSMSAEPPIDKIPSAEMRAERLARDARSPGEMAKRKSGQPHKGWKDAARKSKTSENSLIAAIRDYLATFDRCGGSESVSAEEFAERRQRMRALVAGKEQP